MNEKILIVEDDIDIMEVLSLTVGKANYTVLKATSIAQGWHLAITEQPDLILLDVNLPDGTGFELAKKFVINQMLLLFLSRSIISLTKNLKALKLVQMTILQSHLSQRNYWHVYKRI